MSDVGRKAIAANGCGRVGYAKREREAHLLLLAQGGVHEAVVEGVRC